MFVVAIIIITTQFHELPQAAFPVFIGIILIGGIGGILCAHCYVNSLYKHVTKICEQYSRPSVTFHVRYENENSAQPSYLEVCLDALPTRAALTLDPAYHQEAEVVATHHYSSDRLVDRLTELEDAKGFLSPKEYTTKRKQIIDIL